METFTNPYLSTDDGLFFTSKKPVVFLRMTKILKLLEVSQGIVLELDGKKYPNSPLPSPFTIKR